MIIIGTLKTKHTLIFFFCKVHFARSNGLAASKAKSIDTIAAVSVITENVMLPFY